VVFRLICRQLQVLDSAFLNTCQHCVYAVFYIFQHVFYIVTVEHLVYVLIKLSKTDLFVLPNFQKKLKNFCFFPSNNA